MHEKVLERDIRSCVSKLFNNHNINSLRIGYEGGEERSDLSLFLFLFF